MLEKGKILVFVIVAISISILLLFELNHSQKICSEYFKPIHNFNQDIRNKEQATNALNEYLNVSASISEITTNYEILWEKETMVFYYGNFILTESGILFELDTVCY